ncbi:Retrovirus-related Pol polyprotein from transposon [Tetrabaena socialis]|uniref:Retrovirus-related Pol polyprotein from transposon n=1 Tax=Tetrabaena socialis TaxID=47790 RepID=A0A2J7ZYL5_9CHLO|nr:Retrovirus-related Pol polyprotein from transposon [Tetrabaena socialis]|eukprot:PNH05362.1 Retrovirus-related Pol polyprotein from transposon [Tetrabaena socialis]
MARRAAPPPKAAASCQRIPALGGSQAGGLCARGVTCPQPCASSWSNLWRGTTRSRGGLFARSLGDLTDYAGSWPDTEINLTHDRGIYQHAWRHPQGEYAVMDEKCNALLAAGLIEKAPDGCKYAMNSTMPGKKDEDGQMMQTRFCQDVHQQLNAATIPDSHHIPLIDELFQHMGGASYFTKCDCRAAFNQLLLKYNRLLYGLRNTTSHFQRVMGTHIREWGLQDFVVCYVDDLLVFSRMAAEHVQHLARLFEMLRARGIKLHPETTTRRSFWATWSAARIAAFMALRPPTSLVECQHALGMFGYYRGYIDHYSVKMAPLTHAKTTVWGPGTWGEPQQRTFDTIKQLLILHTDFSGSSISGVLGQLDENSREYMVACVSRTHNVHEQRYGSYESKLLVVVWAVQTLRPYLHGWPFTLVTDQSPLEWLMTQQDLTGQAARWALQGYDFTPRPGCPPTLPAAVPLALVSTCWRARSGSARLAHMLCTNTTASQAFQPAEQPWVLASVRRVARLQLAQASAPQACMPDGAELLAGHAGRITDADDFEPPAVDAAIRTAAFLVSGLHASLRLLRPEPRLPLCVSSTHGPTAGINTSLRQHAFFAAAEEQGVALLEAPGGLAAGLQACLRLGIKVRRYVRLEQRVEVRADLQRRLISELARAHPLCLQLAPWRGDVGGLTRALGAAAVSRLDSMPFRQSGQWLVVGAWGWGGWRGVRRTCSGCWGGVAWSEEDMLGLLGGMQRELRGVGCPAPAYVVQGPGTTEEQQRDLGFPFGVPALLDIAQAGVAMHAPATIYTNLAAAEHLGAVLRRLHAPAERRLSSLLPAGLQAMVRSACSRLRSRLCTSQASGSWRCKRASLSRRAGGGVSEWEDIMGHRAGVVAGLEAGVAVVALRDAVAPPTLVYVLGAALALQHHYVSPHDMQTLPERLQRPLLACCVAGSTAGWLVWFN